MQVAGINLMISKTENAREIVVPAEMIRERYEMMYSREEDTRKRQMLNAMQRGFQGGVTWFRKGDTIVQSDHYNRAPDLWSVVDAANGILAMQEDSEWMQRTLGYQKQNALPWARVVQAAWEGWKAWEKEQAMMLAEANAVEAAPTTQAVIEKLNTLADADMDRLIAEVDDTLATSVVRRWPRLNRRCSRLCR